MQTIPLTRPRGGGFTALGFTVPLMQYKPHFVEDIDPSKPKRKNLVAPPDRGTFVKPVKQCFVKNPRMMPMTRIMLTLLVGWAGQGDPIKTTVGIIGKHLGRCRRQVYRYLKDALEEGYLSYSKTKDRIGRYTGITIRLNFAAIRFTSFKKRKDQGQTAEIIDVTQESDTNTKHLLLDKKDSEIQDALERLATSMGFKSPSVESG